jgi:hypothetical protein
MASLNERRYRPLPGHRLEVTKSRLQVCRLGSYLALRAYLPIAGLPFEFRLLVFMFRIVDRRSRLTQAGCISFRRVHGPVPPHKYRFVDPLLLLLLHPPVQLLRRQ